MSGLNHDEAERKALRRILAAHPDITDEELQHRLACDEETLAQRKRDILDDSDGTDGA